MKLIPMAVAGLLLVGPAAATAAEPAGAPLAPGVPAQLTAVRHTTLSAELAGKIGRVAVREGEAFAQGDTLVAFDCTVERARLAEARALLDAAAKTRDAHKRLLELNSAGTLEVQKAAAETVVAEAKVNLARAVVSQCTIRAPYDGVVVTRGAQDHQYVQPGQALLEILDASRLEAEFIVPSSWALALAVGRPATMHVAETGRDYPARIVRLGGKIDAVSHSVKVFAAIEGRYPDLMAGMTGTMTLSPP